MKRNFILVVVVLICGAACLLFLREQQLTKPATQFSTSSTAQACPAGSQSITFVYVMKGDGGLNNQRAGFLQALVLARNWGIRKVVLSQAILKLHSVQVEMKLSHRFKPPYEYVKLQRAISKYKKQKSWEFGEYSGSIGELFDVELMAKVASQHYIELLPRDVLLLKPAIVGRVVFPVVNRPWEEVLGDTRIRALVNSTNCADGNIGATAMGPSSSPAKQNFVLVESEGVSQFVGNIGACRHMRHCMQLLRAFSAPAPLIQHTFIDPIRTVLNSTYVTIHIRAFNCHFVDNWSERIVAAIDKMVREGKLPSKPKTLYFATSLLMSSFEKLRQQGFTIYSKQTVNHSFNVDDYPFEVMSFVDFEIARRSMAVLSLTIFSTWVTFLDLFRELDGLPPVLQTGLECF